MTNDYPKLAGRRILVTGGAGFIGSHIAEKLSRQGCKVNVLDDFTAGKMENLSFLKSEAIIRGSVTDQKAIEEAMYDAEIVFHEAAETSVQRSIKEPLRTNQINTVGTLHVLMAARKLDIKRMIIASSAAVYGDVGNIPCEENMQPSPLSPYASSKASAEAYSMMYHHLYGMDTVCLRYFNVYGKRQDPASEYAGVIARFAECFKKGKRPTLFGDGNQARDFVHVHDVVKANMQAAIAPKKALGGECVNIASGQAITINALLKLFQEITGKKMTPQQKQARTGDIYHSVADIQKAATLLGFRPQVTLQEGLRKTILEECNSGRIE